MIFTKRNKQRISYCKCCGYPLKYFGVKHIDEYYVPYIKEEEVFLVSCIWCGYENKTIVKKAR